MANPGPALHQELAPLAVGLEIDGGGDFVPDQHRLGEVAEAALVPGDVSLEAVLVAEEQVQALPLVDERVEGGQDVDPLLGGIDR